MSVFTDIHNALNYALDNISSLPTIFYPNDLKQPTQDNAWIRPTLIPAASEIYTMTDESKYSGIYQIDIFVPLKKGIKDLNAYADIILNSFNRATVQGSSDVNIFIQQISISRHQRVESWWSCYVEVGYLCVA